MPTLRLPLLRRQREACNLLVVTHEYTTIREGRVTPDDLPATRVLARVDQVRPTHLLVTLRRQLRDDQVALVVEDERAVALFDQEGRRQKTLLAARSGVCLPHLLAGVGL